MGKKNNQFAKLKKLEAAGTITARQQARLEYLRLKRKKNKGGGGKKGYDPRHPFKKLDKATKKLVVGDTQVEKMRTNEAAVRGNADIIGPTGSTTVVIDPVTGKATQTTELTQPQKTILDQGQDLTITGQEKAKQGVNDFNIFAPGDLNEMRGRVEADVFGRLTRDMDQQYTKDKDQLEQTLLNRGIPLDPNNPLYKDNMQALNDRYDRARLDARRQATELGGAELSRQFGVDLQGHQQSATDIKTLEGLGTGLIAPKTPDYNAPVFDINKPSDVALGLKDVDIKNKQLGIQDKLAGLEAQKLAFEKAKEKARREKEAADENNAFPDGGGPGGQSTQETAPPKEDKPAKGVNAQDRRRRFKRGGSGGMRLF